jgi:raffinose/stachyose/melibiose transport system permease protein
MHRYRKTTFLREAVLILVASLFCIPFYLLFTLSLQTDEQAISSPYTLPSPPTLANFATVLNESPFPGFVTALINSLVITGGTVASLIVLGALGAYVLGRSEGRLSKVLYFAFVLGYILPLQLAIIPIFSAMRSAHLNGTVGGAIVLYTGLLMPLSVFLYTGFVRTMPRAYEEAAELDGASPLTTFWRVVFPLLRPITATVALVAGVVVWNDFFVSLIFLSGSPATTLPAMLYSTVGEFTSRYNLTFAAVLLAILPILIFFVFTQKSMMRGFAGGLR